MAPQPTPHRVQQFPDWPDRFAIFFANYVQAIPEEVARLGCERVFLLVSRSLDRDTDRISKLENALGSKVVGKKVGVKPHTPYADVLELTEQVHKTNADIIVTVGGSSYSDAAKIALIIHASVNASDLSVSAMDSLLAPFGDDGVAKISDRVKAPTLKLILTPTTLSAAEYHPPSAATHPDTYKKVVFAHPGCAAQCVILDPELCTYTPPRVWLGSGMRAVDHCVETLCTERSIGVVDKSSEEGLRNLVPGLLASKANSSDAFARGVCQVGAWKSVLVALRKISLGASHAIGHQLGSVAGVAHGETSCVMLPAVLKYNKSVNGALQQRVESILWDVAGEAFTGIGLVRGKADAADLVKGLVKMLGLPSTLSEVGVTSEAQLNQVAEHTLTDIWGKTNPRPLSSKDQVREILAMAA